MLSYLVSRTTPMISMSSLGARIAAHADVPAERVAILEIFLGEFFIYDAHFRRTRLRPCAGIAAPAEAAISSVLK